MNGEKQTSFKFLSTNIYGTAEQDIPDVVKERVLCSLTLSVDRIRLAFFPCMQICLEVDITDTQQLELTL